jgi:hypothetical protein
VATYYLIVTALNDMVMTETLGEKVPQCRFVHHNSLMTSSRLEFGPPEIRHGLLANPTELSPTQEAVSCAATQELPSILWKK